MKAISDRVGSVDPAIEENYRKQIIAQSQSAKYHVAQDPKATNANYASRDPFVGLVQTNMGLTASTIEPSALANLASDWQQLGNWRRRPAVGNVPNRFILYMDGAKGSLRSSGGMLPALCA